jgi:hypothetical protein
VESVRELHARRATDLAALGDFADAAKHFAVAPEQYAEAHGALVQSWASSGYAGERDLFGARAVLYVLASGRGSRVVAAKRLHAALVLNGTLLPAASDGNAAATAAGAPLSHFLEMTFELIDLMASYTVGKSGGTSAYSALLSAYRPSLAGRDGRVATLAERVGQVHFGWKPPPSPMQGIMDMFKAPPAAAAAAAK